MIETSLTFIKALLKELYRQDKMKSKSDVARDYIQHPFTYLP